MKHVHIPGHQGQFFMLRGWCSFRQTSQGQRPTQLPHQQWHQCRQTQRKHPSPPHKQLQCHQQHQHHVQKRWEQPPQHPWAAQLPLHLPAQQHHHQQTPPLPLHHQHQLQPLHQPQNCDSAPPSHKHKQQQQQLQQQWVQVLSCRTLTALEQLWWLWFCPWPLHCCWVAASTCSTLQKTSGAFSTSSWFWDGCGFFFLFSLVKSGLWGILAGLLALTPLPSLVFPWGVLWVSALCKFTSRMLTLQEVYSCILLFVFVFLHKFFCENV